MMRMYKCLIITNCDVMITVGDVANTEARV